MQVDQGVKDLVGPGQHLGGYEGPPALGQHVGQGRPGHKGHGQKLAERVGEGVADDGQGRVAQAGEDQGLPLKAIHRRRVEGEGLFEGNGLADPLVDRLVDGSHRALADQPDDAIAIMDEGVWRKHRPPSNQLIYVMW